MKPTNVRPDLLLPDGAPTRCRFYAWGERGRTDDCESNATVLLDTGEATRFRQWKEEHRRATIGVAPGPLHLCDAHERIVRECL